MTFPLEAADPGSLGLDAGRLEKLCARIEQDIAGGLHPGAQVAVARHGKLALFRSFGSARLQPAMPAGADTLFLLYSNTKVITAAALWMLAEDGMLRSGDRVDDLLPGFGRNRKGEITIIQLLTHQGGFPSAPLPYEMWADHPPHPRGGVQLHPGLAAGHAGGIPPGGGALGRGDADRGTDRSGFSPLHSRAGDPAAGIGRGDVRRRSGGRDGPLRRHARNEAGGHGADHRGMLAVASRGGTAGRRRLCDGAGDDGVLPDAGAGWPAGRHQGAVAAHHRVHDPQLHRRPDRYGERDDRASRAGGRPAGGTRSCRSASGTLGHPTTFGHGGARSSSLLGATPIQACRSRFSATPS